MGYVNLSVAAVNCLRTDVERNHRHGRLKPFCVQLSRHFTDLSVLSNTPVLDGQALDSLKLSYIVGYQGTLCRYCVARDSGIIAANGCSFFCQILLDEGGFVYCSSIPSEHGIYAAHKIINYDAVLGRGFFADGSKFKLGIGNCRNHNFVALLNMSFQLVEQSYRMLTHNVRTYVGVEHKDFFHSLTRPSSITSGRSIRKSGSALPSLARLLQLFLAGLKISESPSWMISTSDTPKNSKSFGSRTAWLRPLRNKDAVFILFLQHVLQMFQYIIVLAYVKPMPLAAAVRFNLLCAKGYHASCHKSSFFEGNIL